jgi:hypothetical protein
MDTNEQRRLCAKYGVDHVASPMALKVGLAENVRTGLHPINGLRHPPGDDSTGWYIWAGEALSADDDFFRPVHVAHLTTICPMVLPYLGFPPGWRFLIATDYEDIWFDKDLLVAGGVTGS